MISSHENFVVGHAAEQMRAQRHRVVEGLERQRVLGDTGDAEVGRHGARGDDERVENGDPRG